MSSELTINRGDKAVTGDVFSILNEKKVFKLLSRIQKLRRTIRILLFQVNHWHVNETRYYNEINIFKMKHWYLILLPYLYAVFK